MIPFQELENVIFQDGREEYERVRNSLISRLGYEEFRETQNQVFKKHFARVL